MTISGHSVEDIISFPEIFASIWARKLLIITGIIIAVIIGFFYATALPKTYIGRVNFSMTGQDSLHLPGEFSAIAAIAGIGPNRDANGLSLEDMLFSRQFVSKVSSYANLASDRDFNADDGIGVPKQGWRGYIKEKTGNTHTPPELSRRQDENVFNAFFEKITLKKKETGTTVISVEHTRPERAADIANIILDLLIQEFEAAQERNQSAQRIYLSSSLADALESLQRAEQNLKEYALNNNVLSVQAFTTQAIELDNLRQEKSESESLISAITELAKLVNSDNTNVEASIQIRASYPILNDVRFRRLFGLPEIISEWSWPTKSEIETILSTLTDRLSRLDLDINKLEAEAIQFGRASDELFKLEREAKVAEATYTVLVEQVKAQSLSSGFKPEIAVIYDRAIVPIAASSPKIALIVAFIATLVGFVLILAALMHYFVSNTFWTKSYIGGIDSRALLVNINSNMAFRKYFRRKANKLEYFSNNLMCWKVGVNESGSNLIFLLSLRSKIPGYNFAEWLAEKYINEEENVAIFIRRLPKSIPSIEKVDQPESSFDIYRNGSLKYYCVPQSEDPFEFYSRSNFVESVKKIKREVGKVIVVGDQIDSEILTYAFQDQDLYFTVITRSGATKKDQIEKLSKVLQIDAWIHENRT